MSMTDGRMQPHSQKHLLVPAIPAAFMSQALAEPWQILSITTVTYYCGQNLYWEAH